MDSYGFVWNHSTGQWWRTIEREITWDNQPKPTKYHLVNCELTADSTISNCDTFSVNLLWAFKNCLSLFGTYPLWTTTATNHGYAGIWSLNHLADFDPFHPGISSTVPFNTWGFESRKPSMGVISLEEKSMIRGDTNGDPPISTWLIYIQRIKPCIPLAVFARSLGNPAVFFVQSVNIPGIHEESLFQYSISQWSTDCIGNIMKNVFPIQYWDPMIVFFQYSISAHSTKIIITHGTIDYESISFSNIDPSIFCKYLQWSWWCKPEVIRWFMVSLLKRSMSWDGEVASFLDRPICRFHHDGTP